MIQNICITIYAYSFSTSRPVYWKPVTLLSGCKKRPRLLDVLLKTNPSHFFSFLIKKQVQMSRWKIYPDMLSIILRNDFGPNGLFHIQLMRRSLQARALGLPSLCSSMIISIGCFLMLVQCFVLRVTLSCCSKQDEVAQRELMTLQQQYQRYRS